MIDSLVCSTYSNSYFNRHLVQYFTFIVAKKLWPIPTEKNNMIFFHIAKKKKLNRRLKFYNKYVFELVLEQLGGHINVNQLENYLKGTLMPS